MTWLRTLRGFWGGLGAGCAFVIVGLLARVAWQVPTLPELVQDKLVLLLPGPIFSLLLDRFLYLGKPLFFGSLLLAQVVCGGLAGIACVRSRRPALVAGALWLGTGFLVLPLAGRDPFAGRLSVALVTLSGLAVYTVALLLFEGGLGQTRAWLARPLGPLGGQEVQVAAAAPTFDRRRLLAGGGLAVASVLLARLAIGHLPELPPRGSDSSSADGSTNSGDATSGGEAQGDASSPLDAGAGAVLPGLPPEVTPSDRFYIVSKNLLDPEVNAAGWRLQVQGLVGTPLSLRLEDLEALPAVDDYRTLECVSNDVGGDLISNGLWTGARLADVLQQAGVKQGAVSLRFTSADGYTADMPLSQALDPMTLLAYRLGGQTLPYKHGFPLRVLGIGTYGMKNPKWLTRIELLDMPTEGFWQHQGWDEQGIVQTMSVITTPRDGQQLKPGPVTVAGVAFAGGRGISRIEVSSDGGTSWSEATLLPSEDSYTWSFWELPWQPVRAGSYTLSVRATDGTGAVQSVRRADPFPAGATGYHEVRVRIAGA